jgi:hypothetical protein
MVKYNLYFGNKKINKKPLSLDDVIEISKHKTINKKISDSEVQQYNVNDLTVIKCIVV